MPNVVYVLVRETEAGTRALFGTQPVFFFLNELIPVFQTGRFFMARLAWFYVPRCSHTKDVRHTNHAPNFYQLVGDVAYCGRLDLKIHCSPNTIHRVSPTV
jgi:hypothetical protein